jgi:transcriptional regulator with XRE-family HTH domain
LNDFPERLRRLRERERPTRSMRVQSELIGLGTNTLRRYERGEREPKLSELKIIANYYHISLDELCWDEGERE